jgi:hypothetical protein
MINPQLEVKVLFHTSRRIHPKYGVLSTGKYSVEPLPTAETGAQPASNRYVLRFNDEIRQAESGSQPQAEATLFLAYLSLIIGSRLYIESLMVNSVNVPVGQASTYHDYEAVIENLPDIDFLIARFEKKTPEVARQFLRACEVYRSALNLMGENNTLSFFLLTIAVECLSNKVGRGSGSCNRFVGFILDYLPDKSSLPSEQDWKELLEQIYRRHRSGFTHGGKEIPEAVNLADRLNRVYVRNMVDGKEVRTPGLKWFESVVRGALLGFLNSAEYDFEQQTDRFKELSLEYGRVMVKARHNLRAHTAVTEKDVDLD